jgi:hypothetical protein
MQKSIYRILFVFCIVFSGNLCAQRILVEESPDTSTEVPMYGPNRTVYFHQLVKLGVFAPPYDEGLVLNPWCTSVSYELRTKAKICSWNSLILDFGYRCDRFSIATKSAQAIPFFGYDIKRERISLHNLSFDLCDRINFGRRGNILGIYLDYGFYGDYLFRSSNLRVEEYYDSNSPSGHHVISKSKETRLDYINQLNYGLTARMGWEWGSFYGMYRITDLINDPDPFTHWPDLPKLVVGVEMYFYE